MGNWDVLHHLFECNSEAQAKTVYQRLCESHKHQWIDNTRWGLRFGYISKTLLMASTSQKWGWDRDFAGFATNKDPDIAVIQLLDDADDESSVFTPEFCRQPNLYLRWDTLYWHSREQIEWTVPVESFALPPTEDLKGRIVQAIPQLTPDRNNERRFHFIPSQKDRHSRTEPMSELHRHALAKSFSDIHKIGLRTEDRSYILVGMKTKNHGLLYFGYLSLDIDSADFYFSLGSNKLEQEKWLGPYLTPIQDDLLAL